MLNNNQLKLDLFTPCQEHWLFHSVAYNPPAMVCLNCGKMFWQDNPIYSSPEVCGYLTATWAHHYRDGHPWTTAHDIDRQKYLNNWP